MLCTALASTSTHETMAMTMVCQAFFQGNHSLRAPACRKERLDSQRRRSSTVAMFQLPPLPYELDALEPHMSKTTLEYHWGKHQRAYIDNLNKQIKNTELEGLSLNEIVSKAYNQACPLPEFNNASQAWNHDFFFHSMKPGGGQAPTGEIAKLIDKSFGTYEEFVKLFKQAATSHFGSGWAWLSLKDGNLVIDKTPNAVSPLVGDETPLLVLDVWEHAYYLDFQNRRPDYITTFLEHLVDWSTVNARLERVKAGLVVHEL